MYHHWKKTLTQNKDEAEHIYGNELVSQYAYGASRLHGVCLQHQTTRVVLYRIMYYSQILVFTSLIDIFVCLYKNHKY